MNTNQFSSEKDYTENIYTFVKLIKEYFIKIPIIQRDYAQGREDVNDIRNSFLETLYNCISKNDRINLDFIYGYQSQEDKEDKDLKTFIPIDGQQRLTTLFLIHWYLSVKEGKVPQMKEIFIKDRKSKFTYEIRPSSKEFCEAMLMNADNIKLNNLIENKISSTIKDSSWFYLSWNYDPTIQSILNMLDEIHKKFKDSTDELWDRLFNQETITFYFLDLKEFNLTDDLYIKMNSRGLLLTESENFKAKLEQHIKKNNLKINYPLYINNKEVDLLTYFSTKIDTDWTNLFWNYTNEKKDNLDNLIMNFFKAFIINEIASKESKENKEIINELNNLLDKNEKHSSLIRLVNFFDSSTIEKLIKILDLISNDNKKFNVLLNEFFYYNEEGTFKAIIERDVSFSLRIMFHAYCQYLLKWSIVENNKIKFKDIDGLKNWMRIIHNLTENTLTYNSTDDFVRSIKTINRLISKSNDILNIIKDLDELTGFDSEQFKEEKIKAHLLIRSDGWDSLIYDIEQHGYFKGQIGFILFLSGIENYYNNHNNKCDWDEKQNEKYKNEFSIYAKIAKCLFNDKGLKDEIKKDYLMERALLTFGDYLIMEGYNHSFLIDSDRDISWKRLLKRDKDVANHNIIVKNLFTELNKNENNELNTEEIIDTLKGIIDTHSKNNKNEKNDWKNLFITNPKLFEALGSKKLIRKESPHGFVLLKKERMHSYHNELYTYNLFLNLQNNFNSIKYYSAKGDEENNKPGIVFMIEYNKNEYNLKIEYDHNNHSFLMKFESKNGNSIDDEKLLSILQNLQYSNQNNLFIKFVKNNNNDIEIENEIKNLIEQLDSKLLNIKLNTLLKINSYKNPNSN